MRVPFIRTLLTALAGQDPCSGQHHAAYVIPKLYSTGAVSGSRVLVSLLNGLCAGFDSLRWVRA